MTEENNNFSYASLEEIRKRLLDLSSRNSLLNFKFPKARCIRFIEVDIHRIFEELNNNTALSLNMVPKPDLKQLAAYDIEQAQGQPIQLEKTDPTSPKLPTAEKWAKYLGWNSNFELSPEPSLPFSHALQSLVYADELELRAKTIRSSAVSSINETGSNILYLAIGFLEWTESKDSSKKRIAPLYTIPVQLDKKSSAKVGGYDSYEIKMLDEGLFSNVTLQQKLRHDFGLELPALDEEISPDLYFEKIEHAILKHQQNWSIKRQVALVMLNFSKQAMYQDLDPTAWPADFAIEDHPIIQQLFSEHGVERQQQGYHEEYEIDQLNEVHQQFPIIDDADSSQHSALIDAVAGKNIVIEGPPGSGKSQTITNLIGAAINSGKSVLFVAEKMAALNVVKDRLDRAGLGGFCLELHSHKSNKNHILNDLMLQVEAFKQYQCVNRLDSCIQQYETHKKTLNDYVHEVNSNWKNTGFSIHAILNKASYYRQHLDLDPATVAIQDFNADQFKSDDFDRYQNAAKSLAFSTQALMDQLQHQQIQQHAWYGMAHHQLLDFEHEGLTQRLSLWNEALKQLLEVWNTNIERYQVSGHRLPSLNTIETIAEQIQQLPPLSEHIVLSLMPELAQHAQRFDHFIETYAQIWQQHETLGEHFNLIALQSQQHNLAPLEQGLEQLQQHQIQEQVALQQLHAIAGDLPDFFQHIQQIKQCYAQIHAQMPPALQGMLHCSPAGLKAFVDLIGLMRELPADLWRMRDEIFDDVDLDTVLQQLKPIFEHLKPLQLSLADKFRLKDLPEYSLMTHHQAVMQNSGFFSFLSPAWWRSRRFILDLSQHPGLRFSLLRQNYACMVEYANWLNQADEIHRKNAVLASHYVGADTPLAEYIQLRDWYKAVRASYGLGFGERVSIGQALIQFDRNLVLSILSFYDQSIASHIQPVLAFMQRLKDQELLSTVLAEDQDLSDADSTLSQLNAALKDVLPVLNQYIVDQEMSLAQIQQQLPELNALFALKADFAQQSGLIKAQLPQHWHFSTAPDQFDQNAYSEAKATAEFSQHLTQLDQDFRQAFIQQANAETYQGLKAFAQHLQADVLPQIQQAKQEFDQFGRVTEAWTLYCQDQLQDLIARNRHALDNKPQLFSWVNFLSIREQFVGMGMSKLTALLDRSELPADQIYLATQLAIFHALALDIMQYHPIMQSFNGLELSSVVQRFKEYDQQLIQLQRAQIAYQASRKNIPQGISSGKVAQYTELSLIQHESTKKMRHIPIRALLERSHQAIQTLKPCFMMSPMSVSQYLKPGLFEFDLIVMDEASQILPEDAVGALARGKSAVIVGDPKQLPPTSFFSATVNQDDLKEEDLVSVQDAESILDSVLSIFETRRLRWHYRSRHESLIAFSNKQFYDSDLVLFPSPMQQSEEFGIRYHPVNGFFETGVNRQEALVIVEEACRLLLERPHESIGIVAMNSQQRDEIEDQFERMLASNLQLAKIVEDKEQSFEPVFIKNLENVQGDERDVILISMTYGPSQVAGKVFQRFGPINQASGWRRLNVLFTRSKKRMHIFSSMGSADILVTANSSKGVTALKDFLRYCETGGSLHEEKVTGRAPDSEFEIAVMEGLKKRGYDCEPQLGVAGYFLDLAVKNPNHPGQYVLGVECDGATYHSAKSSRDRDRLRQQILEGLGWNIHRIWSTDWFRNPEQQLDILVKRLQTLSTAAAQRTDLNTVVEIDHDCAETLIETDPIACVAESTAVDRTETSTVIEVGDLVRYIDSRSPGKLLNVSITAHANRFEDGITHENSPLAQILLGAEVGDQVVLSLPSGDAHLEVSEIIKA